MPGRKDTAADEPNLNRPLHGVGLAEASALIEMALAHARSLDLPPLSVAVLDNAGRLVAFAREDNSSLMRPEIAQAKAFGALALGMGSRALADRAQTHPAFIQSVTALTGGYLVPVPGGVLIYGAEEKLLGAVGVSGALPDQDEACAMEGVAACGLIAEPASRRH